MPISIVIVDDHEPLRRALRSLLETDARMRVVGEAADGEAAVDLVRKLAPTVVLMDLSMPGIGGVEATRRIVREAPGVHVIGLTLHDDVAHAAALRDAGARCLIAKGGDAEAIWAAILAWSESSTETAPQPPRMPRGDAP